MKKTPIEVLQEVYDRLERHAIHSIPMTKDYSHKLLEEYKKETLGLEMLADAIKKLKEAE